MRTSCIAFVATIALITITGCPGEELVVPPGRVDGIICNPLTGQPYPGATVSVTFELQSGDETTQTVTTGENGDFRLNPGEGQQTIKVTSDAFAFDIVVDVVSGGSLLLQPSDGGCRDLAPPPGQGCLVGQICNEHTGGIVTGARITVTVAGEVVAEDIPTDEETGRYEVCVPTGGYNLFYEGGGVSGDYSGVLADQEVQIVGPQQAQCLPGPPTTHGCVSGRVCLEEGEAPLQVYVNYQNIDGGEFVTIQDVTDDDGEFFVCGIGPTPVTNVTVRVEGPPRANGEAGRGYQWPDDSDPVTVFAENEAVDGTNLLQDGQECAELNVDDGKRFLVVTGAYDRIQDAMQRNNIDFFDLADGCVGADDDGVVGANECQPGDFWTANVFGDYERLANYDAVFVNCGANERDWTGADLPLYVRENLRRYISEGNGNLYVSDWAYELVEQTWPDKIDFLGDDNTENTAQFGNEGTITARAEDPALRTWLQEDGIDPDAVTINLAFGDGVVVERVAADVTVYVRADREYRSGGGATTFPDSPITMGFTEGSGQVFFTSFHQEQDEAVNGPEDSVLSYVVVQLGN
jgi:hypothetical protein